MYLKTFSHENYENHHKWKLWHAVVPGPTDHRYPKQSAHAGGHITKSKQPFYLSKENLMNQPEET